MYSLTSDPFMMIIFLLLILENIGSYISNPSALLGLILSIPGLLVAVTFHEYAHAFVADKLGDDTPRRQGRLTLNPLAHLDPYGTFLMIFAGFGWGKPVEINPVNFNRKVSIKGGSALVAIAGPLMNFILAIICAVVYGLLFKTSFVYSTVGGIVMDVISYTMSMNVGLGVFNLIPLPPLDGSKVLLAILPTRAQEWYENNQRILYIVFLIIWITPIASQIVTPLITTIDHWLVKLIEVISGKYIWLN